MPQWLVIAMLASSLLPLIQQAIKDVEALSAGQAGAFKKEQVLSYLKILLQGTASFSKLDQPTMDALLVMAGNLIDLLVGIFNATGVLPKKAS